MAEGAPLVNVAPLNERRKGRPVAVIVRAGLAGLEVRTLSGDVVVARGRAASRDALVALSDHFVYTTTKPTLVLLATGSSCWEGYQWKGALARMRLDAGPWVYPIRQAVKGWDADEAVSGLSAALSWLRGRDVVPGSVGSMAWRLWRSTLRRPVRIAGPRIRDALYGGRQEAPWPGTLSEARYYDLGAAYPASMGTECYPARMVRVSPRTKLAGAGMARASVRIPRMPWCPLPVRVGRGALCYGYGDAEGWWPWRELAMARDAGCSVTVHESYAGTADADLFGPWWEVVREGRRLPGAAGAIVKVVTSSLWGQFSLEPEGGAVVRWEDDECKRPVIVREVRQARLPQEATVHVAAETTARVRERLWREALSVLPTAVYCDTDAVIAAFDESPQPAGSEPGQWGVKATMATVEIRGPQLLRHLCPTCEGDHPAWHYTVAGAPTPDLAARIFARSGGRNTAVAMAPHGEVTLPKSDLAKYARPVALTT